MVGVRQRFLGSACQGCKKASDDAVCRKLLSRFWVPCPTSIKTSTKSTIEIFLYFLYKV